MEQPSLRTIRILVEGKSDDYEIKLNGSLTTMELKKPHLSRLVGGVQTQSRLVPHPHAVDKNLGRISQEPEVRVPHQSPQPRVPVPGRLNPQNFCLQKAMGIESVEETSGAPSSYS